MSRRILPRELTVDILTNLQPILLLPVLMGLSQAVNDHVSRSQAQARALLLSGQRRLRSLLMAAPRLRLPLHWRLGISRSDEDEEISEKAAAQALLELCIGLVLQWMTEHSREFRATATLLEAHRPPSENAPALQAHPPRVRLCFLPSLA